MKKETNKQSSELPHSDDVFDQDKVPMEALDKGYISY